MEIYNLKNLNQDKRFIVSIIAGIAAAIGLGILSGYFRQLISFGNIEFPVIYWAAAYGTALTIQKVGRGVQPRFSILGAICGFITVVISDIVSYFGVSYIFTIEAYTMLANLFFRADIFAFLSLIYRAVCVYIGYAYSRLL